MKKVLKYLEKEAIAGQRQIYRPAGSAPSEYIYRRIEEDATKDGEVQPASGLGDLGKVRTLDCHQAAANAVIAAGLVKHQYASDNILQGYDVYVPEEVAGMTVEEEERRVWVIFIHGGYWCDPQQLAHTFTATRAMLLTHPTLKSTCTSIAGYASLNYRLSPHPSFPQSKTKTSAYEMRNARHPDHINDVLAALRDLQRRHGFGERYLLCGHGCGATLALQVAMGRRWTGPGPFRIDSESHDDVIPPLAILGIDGLYDLPLARATYKDDPFYQRFLGGAFGRNEDDWARASPARWTRYAESWGKGSLVVLAHSHDDELVDWGQVEAMDRCWRERQEGEGDGKANNKLAEMRVMEIGGSHADIWKKGFGMAGPIGNAISLMLRMEGDAE